MYVITMENFVNKPPKSAVAYYVKLYRKKKSLTHKDPSDIQIIQKALKSWHSLSVAEQQPFFHKFRKCQQEYEKKYAVYLKSVEPFMKKKPSRKESIEKHCALEIGIANHECQIQISRKVLQNNDDIVESNEESFRDEIYTTSVIGSTSPLEEEKQENQIIQRLPEPTPPSMRNGKELFEAVNVIEENELNWKNLSHKERAKYNSAILSIKKDYIRKYQNYLENLPDEELFQHYIKSLED